MTDLLFIPPVTAGQNQVLTGVTNRQKPVVYWLTLEPSPYLPGLNLMSLLPSKETAVIVLSFPKRIPMESPFTQEMPTIILTVRSFLSVTLLQPAHRHLPEEFHPLQRLPLRKLVSNPDLHGKLSPTAVSTVAFF